MPGTAQSRSNLLIAVAIMAVSGCGIAAEAAPASKVAPAAKSEPVTKLTEAAKPSLAAKAASEAKSASAAAVSDRKVSAKAVPAPKATVQVQHAAGACARPAFKIVRGDGFEILSISTDLLYDKDLPSLRPSAAPLLTQIAAHLERLGKHPVSVSVHSDALGFESFEEKLTRQRAETVKSWLLQNQQGLAPGDLSAAGYGRRKPIALNSNADGTDNPVGRAANRRLEIIVHTNQAGSSPAANAALDGGSPVASVVKSGAPLPAGANAKSMHTESLSAAPLAGVSAAPESAIVNRAVQGQTHGDGRAAAQESEQERAQGAARGMSQKAAPAVTSGPLAAGQNSSAADNSASELGPDFVKVDPSLLEKYLGAGELEPPAGADAGGKAESEKSFDTAVHSQGEAQSEAPDRFTSNDKHLGNEKNSFGEHDGDTRRVPAQPSAEEITKREKEAQWAREEFGLFRDHR